MAKRSNGYGSENRVNILKKVKIGKNLIWCNSNPERGTCPLGAPHE